MPNPARLGLLFLLPSNRLSVKIDQISSYSYSDLFFFLFFFPLSNPLTNLQAIPACVIVVEIQTSSSFPLPDGLRLTPNTPKSSTPHSPPLLFFFFPSPSSTLSLPPSLPPFLALALTVGLSLHITHPNPFFHRHLGSGYAGSTAQSAKLRRPLYHYAYSAQHLRTHLILPNLNLGPPNRLSPFPPNSTWSYISPPPRRRPLRVSSQS
jgi:hypothetical protein